MFKETVTLKFLDSYPREGIKPNNGLYPKCPKVGCGWSYHLNLKNEPFRVGVHSQP